MPTEALAGQRLPGRAGCALHGRRSAGLCGGRVPEPSAQTCGRWEAQGASLVFTHLKSFSNFK